MKVLVTGANGFIGHHVCRWLRDKDVYVIATGRQQEAGCVCDEYVYCDLNSDDVFGMLDNVREKNIDAVIHLAADTRHEPYTVAVVENNCTGTQRLLELCHQKKIGVFVQLSSLPVIGYKPVQHPITEDHPLHPPTVYHVTKHTQEMLANYAWYTFGLRTVSFRISAPVGEGMNAKTIFPVFVESAVCNKDLSLYGKGSRKQTYVHVNDISQAIYKAILSPNAQGVYNLASFNIISNYDLAQKCIELTKSSSQICFAGVNDPLDDAVWDVSLDKIIRDIGYMPEVSIEDAILEYADLLRNK